MNMKYTDFCWVADQLLTHRWIFAKTMATNPHHYTLRKEWQDQDFEKVVVLMREFGYIEMFAGRPYTQFNVNNQKFWTMGAPVAETILINRKPITVEAGYDVLAATYDDLFADAESRAEDARLFELLPELHDVLDIGCGTGLLLNHRTPARYTGIDPSAAMLGKLLQRYPDHTQHVICARFEDFYPGKHRQFKQIVALYGTASYISPDALQRVPQMLAPGGSFFLMFYKPNYYPVTMLRSGRYVPHFPDNHTFCPGELSEFGNFIVATGQAA